jgi:hypothetical protein
MALDLAAWRCRGGLAGLSLALEGANGGACSVIALLVAVVPGQGGERCAQILSGAAPFLHLGVAWGVGVVLQGCVCDCCCCLLATCLTVMSSVHTPALNLPLSVVSQNRARWVHPPISANVWGQVCGTCPTSLSSN